MHQSHQKTIQRIQRKMIFLSVLFLLLSALCLIWLKDYTAVDLNIADFYYDTISHTFPYKYSWFAKTFMHTFVKNCIFAGGIFLIAFCLSDSLLKFPRYITLGTFSVRAVKRLILNCLMPFPRTGKEGDALPQGMLPQACGWQLFVFFIFLLGLSICLAMDWLQQMRGAHSLSHTLWSL